jgi:hypothetical protein
MMIREYNFLKLRRTYIGGSKKEELKEILRVQGIEDGKSCENLKIDWLNVRRLAIINFEDIIHVTFSRQFVTKKLSYLFLLLALIVVSFKVGMLFFICFGLLVISQIFFQYFKHNHYKQITNYIVLMTLTNNMIREELGLNMPDIE